MAGITHANHRQWAAWITIHSKHTFDVVLSRLYSEVGGPGNSGSQYHAWFSYQEINHDEWLHRAGIPSDGLKCQRVSLGNPQFAVEFSLINPKAGLAFPFEVLISEDHDGEVDLVWHLPSVVIMTLIKDHSLNLRFLEMDVSFGSLIQRVASGVVGPDNGRQENREHQNGGEQNGGPENRGQQNRRLEYTRQRSHTSAGHEFGQCENRAEENGGPQKEDDKNGGTENKEEGDKRRPTLGGHEIERFRPIREEIEARWKAAGLQAVFEEEEE